MRFGIMFGNAGPLSGREPAMALARLAEEHGFDSLWAAEHVAIPSTYESPYPYSDDGKMPGGDDVALGDPLVWLAFVAGLTSRVRLGTSVLILPQRNPVVLAKELATIDLLSGGRVELGIGMGWLAEEFDALGVPFTDRVARAEEHVEVLRVLWRDDEATFAGRFTSFDRIHVHPKPVQAGGIPVVVGGNTRAAARRAGRLGNGFFPFLVTPEELVPRLEVMKAAAKDAGRDPDAIEVSVGGWWFDVDTARRFEDLGVVRLAIPPLGFDPEALERALADFAEQVMAPVG
jgi:probable F420-dependent oxidoreductase